MSIEPLNVPLWKDESGAYRVGKTRVLLDLVIRAFQDGATPETIVQRYESLHLADVYAVIGFYLTHQQEIDHYLADRERDAEALRAQIEAVQPPRPGFRQQLLDRLAKRGKSDASAGQ